MSTCSQGAPRNLTVHCVHLRSSIKTTYMVLRTCMAVPASKLSRIKIVSWTYPGRRYSVVRSVSLDLHLCPRSQKNMSEASDDSRHRRSRSGRSGRKGGWDREVNVCPFLFVTGTLLVWAVRVRATELLPAQQRRREGGRGRPPQGEQERPRAKAEVQHSKGEDEFPAREKRCATRWVFYSMPQFFSRWNVPLCT